MKARLARTRRLIMPLRTGSASSARRKQTLSPVAPSGLADVAGLKIQFHASDAHLDPADPAQSLDQLPEHRLTRTSRARDGRPELELIRPYLHAFQCQLIVASPAA